MSEYNKYQKYKSKYLALKLQTGGNHNRIQLESKTEEFVNSLASATPIYKLPPNDARDVLNNLQKDNFDIPTKSIDIPISVDNNNFTIRIIKPKDVGGLVPTVVYYHGGGWILGNKMTHDRLVREISYGAHVGVVFVEYTPSPEAKFMEIIKQCYTALAYISEKGNLYNLDTTKIAVAGDSVGGNLCIAMTLLAKERGLKIQRQALFYPVTDARMNTKSYHQFKDGPWLTKKAMEWFWDAYAPNISDRQDILLSPINATQEQLKGLPLTLVITDENDVLRDEGEQYARNLMAANVPVTAVRFLGTIHDFMMLNPLRDTSATRGAIQLSIDFLKNL